MAGPPPLSPLRACRGREAAGHKQFGLIVPLVVWTLSVVLSCTLISRQKFCSRSYWMIPVFAMANSVFYVLAFLVLGRLETA